MNDNNTRSTRCRHCGKTVEDMSMLEVYQHLSRWLDEKCNGELFGNVAETDELQLLERMWQLPTRGEV